MEVLTSYHASADTKDDEKARKLAEAYQRFSVESSLLLLRPSNFSKSYNPRTTELSHVLEATTSAALREVGVSLVQGRDHSSGADSGFEAHEAVIPSPSPRGIQHHYDGYDMIQDMAHPSDVKTEDLDASSALETQPLRDLLREGTSSSRFARSIIAIREIRRFERGLWIMDLRKWTADLIDKLWFRIKRFIQDNQCGWSITSYLCKTKAGNISPGTETSIVTFCFGELMRHTLAMLFAMSEGSIRFTSPRWLDHRGIMSAHVGDFRHNDGFKHLPTSE